MRHMRVIAVVSTLASASLGLLLLPCASASAATITFTSTPPSPAVAGGSYEVSATSSSGGAVRLSAQGSEGACSFGKPDLEKELPSEAAQTKQPAEEPEPPESPATVYFIKAGTCSITAAGSTVEHASQSFTVGISSPEQITFISTAPSAVVVGESYRPRVRSSAGLAVTFSIATPSVCLIAPGSNGGQHVSLIAAGTCTIAAASESNAEYAAAETQQSFTVSRAAQQIVIASPAPTAATVGGPKYSVSAQSYGQVPVTHATHSPVELSSTTPPVCAIQDQRIPESDETTGASAQVSFIHAGRCTIAASNEGSIQYVGAETQQSFTVYGPFLLLARPSFNHKSAVIRLKTSFAGPGTLSWRLTFKSKSGAADAYGKGTMTVTDAPPTITVKPTGAALNALKRAGKQGHGLSVNALLRFEPSSGASPVSLERSIVVRLK